MKFEELNLCGYKYNNGYIYISSKNDNEKDKIICNQLLYPSKIIYNLEDETFKVELHFIENNKEKSIIVDKEIIASKSKIISLSNYGIYVNSNNANQIITYLSEIISHNGNIIPRVNSVSRLGWVGKEFVPLSDKIMFDGEINFKNSFNAINNPKGDFKEWTEKIQNVRKNKIVRLIIDASFASSMLEITGSLPFVVLIWGGTGLGKTVALKVAASIWGNPDGVGLINNMDSTTNFIYRTMGFYHDLPGFFDELQVFRGNKNQLIMTITQGIDRGKADKDKGNKKKETWKNVAIFTGEDSISTSNSGGGTLNRLIEIYLNQPLFDDCMGIMDFIRANYGLAGKEFVKYISSKDKEYVKNIYKNIFKEILSIGKTADKQASSMANILTADRLLNEFIFNEEPLNVDDIKDFMFFKEEIDVSERAYDYFISEIIGSNQFFVKEKPDSSLPQEQAEAKREYWGSISPYEIMILRTKFDKIMKCGEFNTSKTIKEWADKGYLIKNSQNRYNHQTSVFGIKGNFLKIKVIDREKEKNNKKEANQLKEKTVEIVNQYKGTDYTQDDLFVDVKLPW